MPDYSNSKIYAIRSFQTDEIYIGSTAQSLAMRMVGHRRCYQSWKNGNKKFVSSFILLDKYDDCYIEMVENFECKSKEELRKREGEVIRITDNCVNKNIAGRTKKEWSVDNFDKIKEQKKEYYIQNFDKIKDWRIQNSDMLKEKSKDYRIRNPDKIKEIQKEYYFKNSDKLKEKSKEKIICECGSEISKSSLNPHKKTKKHLDYLEKM